MAPYQQGGMMEGPLDSRSIARRAERIHDKQIGAVKIGRSPCSPTEDRFQN